MPTPSIRRLRGAQREAHARAALERLSRSRLSRGAFCRKEGISPVTLARWRREFPANAGPSPEQGRFVEIRLPGAGGHSPFELELGDGRRLRVPPGFDADDLVRLLGVLARGTATC